MTEKKNFNSTGGNRTLTKNIFNLLETYRDFPSANNVTDANPNMYYIFHMAVGIWFNSEKISRYILEVYTLDQATDDKLVDDGPYSYVYTERIVNMIKNVETSPAIGKVYDLAALLRDAYNSTRTTITTLNKYIMNHGAHTAIISLLDNQLVSNEELVLSIHLIARAESWLEESEDAVSSYKQRGNPVPYFLLSDIQARISNEMHELNALSKFILEQTVKKTYPTIAEGNSREFTEMLISIYLNPDDRDKLGVYTPAVEYMWRIYNRSIRLLRRAR